ncbi:hypothetical protein KXW58_008508 [Aspergillus fumigatus]|nr:hypothetical protein KXW58_008508 [Aspergillus fumigatus]
MLQDLKMQRDNYGLRTHFPRSEHIGFAEESSEEGLASTVAHFHKQVASKNLERDTAELRDTLRVFNSFRFNIPHIQSEIFKAIPQLITGVENAALYPQSESENAIGNQQFAAESRNIRKLRTAFQEFNAGLLKIQGILSKFLTGQVTPRTPAEVHPYIRVDSPASVSIVYEKVGILSGAMVNCSCVGEEMTKDDVEHHLRPGDKSFPPTISVSTTPARIYNICKIPRFQDKEKCYVYIIDPDILQALGVTCRSTPVLVDKLGIKKYSPRNQDGAQYVTASHHICHAFIPAEAIIMKIRLDAYYSFLEKTGIAKAETLLDTSYSKKPTVQDYFEFARTHNTTNPANSQVELGPAASGFLFSQEHVAGIGVESLVTEMSALNCRPSIRQTFGTT